MIAALPPDLAEAIAAVTARQAVRIAAPGKWKVWREGGRVKHAVLS